jgi:hypothetical protein
MKAKGQGDAQRAVVKNEIRSSSDLGARIRKLHKDYKKAMAMTMAGKTDIEILEALKVPDLTEEGLKKNMTDLLKHLRLDSFDTPALQSRPVRRALKEFWVYQIGPE